MTELPAGLRHAIVWLVLGTAVFLGVQAWQAQQRRAAFSAEAGVVELRRAGDGHFHWPGRLNGVEVDFLVDTGATRTALPETLARAAGLQPIGRTQAATAGGVVQGWTARAELALDGGVRVERLVVTVLPGLATPLLGMDVLGRLHYSQQGGVLRLEPADPR